MVLNPIVPVVGDPGLVPVVHVGMLIKLVNVGPALNTALPLPVDDVTPVPPFATFNVPANVTGPVVAVDGVKPVVPALNEVIPIELGKPKYRTEMLFVPDGGAVEKVKVFVDIV